MDGLKKALDKITITLCIVIFIAMVLLTTYQVGMRYLFKSPSSISETLTRYLFVWLVILSATYVFGQRDHICITFVKDKLSPPVRRVVEIINNCVIILFSVLIMLYGGQVIARMNMVQYDSILKIPTGIIYSIIPICGVIIIFYSVLNILKDIKGEEVEHHAPTDAM